MRHTFSTIAAGNVLSVDIDEKQVIGLSSPEGPSLLFHVRLDLSYPFRARGHGLELQELKCRLSIDAGHIAPPVPVRCNILVHADFPESKDNLIHVVVPLDMHRLSLMDRARRDGRLSLRLGLEAHVVELAEVGRTQTQHPRPVWGIVGSHRLTCEAPVVLDQGHWTTMVLPHTGFGDVLIVELPRVRIEQDAQLKGSFAALKQAQRLLRDGFANEAVGQCRVALEPFFEPADPQNPAGPKRLKASWETRLGEATYVWLNDGLGAVKKATNKPHHVVGAHFKAADALMLLTITTALISYAANVDQRPPGAP